MASESSTHTPSTPPPRMAWYRLANGIWTPTMQVDRLDAEASAQYINMVRGGALVPTQNPATFELPSRRKLEFSWENAPNVHARVVTNVFWRGTSGRYQLSERPI
jgi:hypothetical protein